MKERVGRGVSRRAYFCKQSSSPFCLVFVQYVYFILSFVQKALFSTIQVGATMYDKGQRDINTVLHHCKSALDMQNVTQTDRMMSRVIIKHLCNYRNSFKK